MSNENRWPNAGRLGDAQVRIAPAAAEVREQPRVTTPTTGEATAPPLVIPRRGEQVPRVGGSSRGGSSSVGRGRGGTGTGRAREREAPARRTQGREIPPAWARGAAELTRTGHPQDEALPLVPEAAREDPVEVIARAEPTFGPVWEAPASPSNARILSGPSVPTQIRMLPDGRLVVVPLVAKDKAQKSPEEKATTQGQVRAEQPKTQAAGAGAPPADGRPPGIERFEDRWRREHKERYDTEFASEVARLETELQEVLYADHPDFIAAGEARTGAVTFHIGTTQNPTDKRYVIRIPRLEESDLQASLTLEAARYEALLIGLRQGGNLEKVVAHNPLTTRTITEYAGVPVSEVPSAWEMLAYNPEILQAARDTLYDMQGIEPDPNVIGNTLWYEGRLIFINYELTTENRTQESYIYEFAWLAHQFSLQYPDEAMARAIRANALLLIQEMNISYTAAASINRLLNPEENISPQTAIERYLAYHQTEHPTVISGQTVEVPSSIGPILYKKEGNFPSDRNIIDYYSTLFSDQFIDTIDEETGEVRTLTLLALREPLAGGVANFFADEELVVDLGSGEAVGLLGITQSRLQIIDGVVELLQMAQAYPQTIFVGIDHGYRDTPAPNLTQPGVYLVHDQAETLATFRDNSVGRFLDLNGPLVWDKTYRTIDAITRVAKPGAILRFLKDYNKEEHSQEVIRRLRAQGWVVDDTPYFNCVAIYQPQVDTNPLKGSTIDHKASKGEAASIQEVTTELRRRIISGELGSGDRLPTVAELSRQTGLNRGSAYLVYSQLHDEELIYGVRGRGTYVRQVGETVRTVETLKATLRQQIQSGELNAGTHLPFANSFAKQNGVSLNSAKRVYSDLIAEGWLEAKRGHGTKVVGRSTEQWPETLTRREKTLHHREQITARLLSFNIPEGAPLYPSVLVNRLGVGIRIVHQTLNDLERQGHITLIRGEGYYYGTDPNKFQRRSRARTPLQLAMKYISASGSRNAHDIAKETGVSLNTAYRALTKIRTKNQ